MWIRALSYVVCFAFSGLLPVAVPAAHGQMIITTDPAGNPVVIEAGQLLTLRHDAGDNPDVRARIWSLFDENDELVPGASDTPEPIFDWVNFPDENPLFLDGSEGPEVGIIIFVPGFYRIRLQAIGSGEGGAITSNRAPGFVEVGDSLTLTAPMGSNYQWEKDGAVIPGATDQTLILNPVTPSDAGTYVVTFDDGFSKLLVESAPFVLEVLPAGSLILARWGTLVVTALFLAVVAWWYLR